MKIAKKKKPEAAQETARSSWDIVRTDRPLNTVHNLLIAAVVCLALWNVICACWWMFGNQKNFGIIPCLPKSSSFFGVLTLLVGCFGAAAAYGLVTRKCGSWRMAAWALCGSALLKSGIAMTVSFLEGGIGVRAGVMAVVEAVLCLIAVGVVAYYPGRADHFSKPWKKELGHHLTIAGMFVLMFWCLYCGMWWLGTQRMVFNDRLVLEYPTVIPGFARYGWILGLISMCMVVYLIATVNGLVRYKRGSQWMAVLAFPVVVATQVAAYWLNYAVGSQWTYDAVGFLLKAVVIAAVGVAVARYYWTRKERFANKWE